jgi:hypothetical protein
MGGICYSVQELSHICWTDADKEERVSVAEAGEHLSSEYHDRFIQLSRYTPDEVAEDERKKEHFIEGLNGPLHYALVAHTFPSF